MNFDISKRAETILAQVREFFETEILPHNRAVIRAARERHDFDLPLVQELRDKARSAGLWNFAMTALDDGIPGQPLSNSDYAPIAEYLGRVLWASKVFNCQWPDVPNMVGLQACATPAQRARWLHPLLNGECHSAFAMTEPDAASSDASNVGTRIRREGDEYVIDGRKWYITGAAHPKCRYFMLLGITDPDAPRNKRQSVVMVPRDTPGVTLGPRSSFFSFLEPNGPAVAIRFDGVRIPVENRIGEEGDGFVVAQARLAPARLHHCMRTVGQCELMIELMMARAAERSTFGAPIIDNDSVQQAIALSRVETEQIRLLVQKSAWQVDQVGAQRAFRDLAILKVGVAQAFHRIAERAVQIFGAMGGHEAGPVAETFAWSRAFRIADGPDEVHLRSIFRREPWPKTSIADSPYFAEPDLYY